MSKKKLAPDQINDGDMRAAGKESVMSVERSNVKLKMDFNVHDVIDVLVSEQEQNIENQIANAKVDLGGFEKELKVADKAVHDYVRKVVRERYEGRIDSIESSLKEIGANVSLKFEIIDGSAMPRGKRQFLGSKDRELSESSDDKIVVALIICNKDFDRDTVDNAVSFYLEFEYDDELRRLSKVKDDVVSEIEKIQKQIRKYEEALRGTDRLVRKAKAAVTKKAIGQDVDSLLAEFRQEHPQVQLKQIV